MKVVFFLIKMVIIEVVKFMDVGHVFCFVFKYENITFMLLLFD